jgi:hypothetical protein
MGRKRIAFAIVSAFAFALSSVGAASTIIETGWGPVSFNLGFKPRELPRREMTPVAVGFSGRFSSRPGNAPPAIRSVTVDFDKNSEIDSVGLPVCAKRELEERGTRDAREHCRKSILGTGVAHVRVSPSRPLSPIQLTLFNGGTSHRITTVFMHGVVPAPTPQPTVVTFELRKIHHGRFGLRSIAKIPPIADDAGFLIDFEFSIDRQFTSRGVRQSFVKTRCPDDHLTAHFIAFTFSNGETFPGNTFTRPCVATD